MSLTQENFSEELVKWVPALEADYRRQEQWWNADPDLELSARPSPKFGNDKDRKWPYKYYLTLICEDILAKHIESLWGNKDNDSEVKRIFTFIEKMEPSPDPLVQNAFWILACDTFRHKAGHYDQYGPLMRAKVEKINAGELR